MTAVEAMSAIHAAGGTSVVAHPGNGLPDENVRELIDCGIDGIEVYHPLHSYEKERKYLRMADELGALVSGGSDAHGTARDWARIGTIRLDNGLVRKLEERARSRRRQTA